MELIELARLAPSSMNGQPWHFVLVRSEENKARLAEIKNRYCPPAKRSFPADFLRRAAWIVVVCVDREKSCGREVENATLATTILLLAAHNRGLAGVFLTAYSSEEPGLSDDVRALFGIPAGMVPVTIVPLGRPDEVPAAKHLTPLEEMVHVEKF
jgi:nitroreductase